MIRSRGIGSIQLHELEAQKLVLVLPFLLTSRKTLAVCWWWRRICDLGDQICSRCLGNSVDEDAQQGDSKENVEPDTESKQEALSIVEPMFLLLFCEVYAGEIGFELWERSV